MAWSMSTAFDECGTRRPLIPCLAISQILEIQNTGVQSRVTGATGICSEGTAQSGLFRHTPSKIDTLFTFINPLYDDSQWLVAQIAASTSHELSHPLNLTDLVCLVERRPSTQ